MIYLPFLMAESQFHLAAVSRILLSKLSESVILSLSEDFPEADREEKFSQLFMLTGHVSLPIYRLSLALAEVIITCRSLLAMDDSGVLELSSEAGTLNTGTQIPKNYFITRLKTHALLNDDSANLLWTTLYRCLLNDEVTLDCGVKHTPTSKQTVKIEWAD